jgi:hypothetical protein
MINYKTSLIAASALASALLIGSPLALADHHGKPPFGERPDMDKMCEQFREGTGPFDPDAREKRMAEHRAEAEKYQEEMAKRLKLTEEQRKIWDEIHQERREKFKERAEHWKEKLEKRCAEE